MQKYEQLSLEPYTGPHTALVPMSDHRAAWNTIHSANLPEHNNALTKEQAKQINAYFDIVLEMGRHGYSPDVNDNQMTRPSQEEYDHVASIIENMEEGDVLFVEGHGFTMADHLSPYKSRTSHNTVPARSPELIYEGGFSPVSSFKGIIEHDKRMQRQRLERQKRNYKLDAWSYGSQLATLKGIDVVRADFDAFQDLTIDAVSKGEWKTKGHDMDPKDHPLRDRIHREREKAAANIVKDFALANLPPKGTEPPKRKPKLVVLWGGGHTEEMKKVFDDLKLNAVVNKMEYTNEEDRHKEMFKHVTDTVVAPALVNAIAQLTASIAAESGRIINTPADKKDTKE